MTPIVDAPIEAMTEEDFAAVGIRRIVCPHCDGLCGHEIHGGENDGAIEVCGHCNWQGYIGPLIDEALCNRKPATTQKEVESVIRDLFQPVRLITDPDHPDVDRQIHLLHVSIEDKSDIDLFEFCEFDPGPFGFPANGLLITTYSLPPNPRLLSALIDQADTVGLPVWVWADPSALVIVHGMGSGKTRLLANLSRRGLPARMMKLS